MMCILYWTISVATSDKPGGRRASDADLETVITDLLDGQYSNPVCVIGFNTAEG